MTISATEILLNGYRLQPDNLAHRYSNDFHISKENLIPHTRKLRRDLNKKIKGLEIREFPLHISLKLSTSDLDFYLSTVLP